MSSSELHAEMGATRRAPIWAVAFGGYAARRELGRRRTKAAAASDQAARRFDEDTPAGGDRVLADEGRGRRDAASLYNLHRRLITVRRAQPSPSVGSYFGRLVSPHRRGRRFDSLHATT